MERSAHDYLFTLAWSKSVKRPLLRQKAMHWKHPQKLWLPEMPPQTKTRRAAVSAQTEVTFRPIPSVSTLFGLRAYLLFRFHGCLQIALCVGGKQVQLPIQRSTTSERRDGAPHPCSVFRGLFVVLHKREEKKAFACDRAHITVGLIKALCVASPAICSHCLHPETWQGVTLDFMLTQRL